VRIVDARVPSKPKEVGFFVPPAGQNPVKPSQRGVLSQTPQHRALGAPAEVTQRGTGNTALNASHWRAAFRP
jgi:hypothetical protein